QKLNFKGEEVSFCAATPAIDFIILKIQTLKHTELEKFLERKAHAAKGNTHIYGYTTVKVPDKEDNIYLHLVPEVYRKVFLDFCTKYGYQPMFLMTLAAIAPALLTNEKDNFIEMVVAAGGESTFIVVGKKNHPLLVREVPYSWNDNNDGNLERLGREIQRTVLFTKQQFNLKVQEIRFIGQNSQIASELTGDMEDVKKTVINENVNWCKLTLTMNPFRTDNLLPRKLLGLNKKRKLSIYLAVTVILILLFSLVFEMSYLKMRYEAEKSIKESGIEASIDSLQIVRQTLENKKSEMTKNQIRNDFIQKLNNDPIPGWFANSIADNLPQELNLSRMMITKDSTEGNWFVQIEGFAPRNPVTASQLLDTFENRLKKTPSFFQPELPWKIQWIDNLQQGSTLETEIKGKVFRIHGRLK
ncbi:MAG: hypothetical protein ACM31E_10470, partial [Fibrobacterota bacterium]|nr:hypothetical protein [Chitinispirillaceae bacterium]